MDLNHPSPVFTDDTGTRARRARRLVRGSSGLCAVAGLVVLLSMLLGVPLPGLDPLPWTKHAEGARSVPATFRHQPVRRAAGAVTSLAKAAAPVLPANTGGTASAARSHSAGQRPSSSTSSPAGSRASSAPASASPTVPGPTPHPAAGTPNAHATSRSPNAHATSQSPNPHSTAKVPNPHSRRASVSSAPSPVGSPTTAG